MIREASLMLCTRGWPTGKRVVKEEIFSLGSVFFAMSVVNVGSVGVVATVAVRVVVEIAFHTSLASEVSSRATPATWALTVGVRPEKVTTASLASTSAPAAFAAACTIAASFLSSARGVMVPASSAARTTAGPKAFGSRLNVAPARGDLHRAGHGDVGELAAHPGQLLGTHLGCGRHRCDLDGAVTGPPAAHGVGGARRRRSWCR